MYLLIYNSHDNFPSNLPTGRFIKLNVSAIYTKIDTSDFLYQSNLEEYYIDQITEYIDKPEYVGIRAVIITKELGGNGWGRAVNLTGHIACSKFQKCSLNSLPIILTDWTDLDIEDSTLKETSVNNFLQTEGIYFRKYEHLFSKKSDSLDEDQYAIDKIIKKFKPIKINNLNIKSPYDNRHQSTNEWGAIRLASNFGLANSIQFKYPRHLYFKYLVNFVDSTKTIFDSSLTNLFNNILLIDDNADCGWQELLHEIFSCKIDKLKSAEEALGWQNVAPSKFKKYDLIFLDLYLERNLSDSSKSINILKFLKKDFPEIPVIIFTASDKAWNLDKVLELGADTMYVKESPLHFNESTYSENNFRDFKENVLYVRNKYKVLTPYWKAIEVILSSQNFLTIEDTPKKIRSRINERLKMFYGLLKKGYEQWDYDKNTFYYSDYELAFMTLWSVLNEVQEDYYTKKDMTPIIGLKDRSGFVINKQKDNRDIIPITGFNWVIKNQTDYFISHEFDFVGYDSNGSPLTISTGNPAYKLKSIKSRCGLLYDRSVPPYYSNGVTEDRTTSHRELSNQIAFLILNKRELKSSMRKEQYLESLHKLSDIRNHLYLTHGDSSIQYFISTEKDKRSQSAYHITPGQNIKELFELVAFLLTGKEIQISIV